MHSLTASEGPRWQTYSHGATELMIGSSPNHVQSRTSRTAERNTTLPYLRLLRNAEQLPESVYETGVGHLWLVSSAKTYRTTLRKPCEINNRGREPREEDETLAHL